jgi:small subunit ribosomal protein S20
VATHKSARKRARQSIRRRARNRDARTRVKGAVKKARTAIGAGDPQEAERALRTAEGVLRKAASKRAIPRKRASRQVSRLARRAHRASS